MFARLFNGIFAVGGAGAFSQFPEFYQQYTAVLFGRIKEGEIVVQDILRQIESESEEAAKAGLGRLLEIRQEALERLWAHYDALETSGSFQKVITLARTFELDTARSTWEQFEPGLAFTAESAVYAGIGMLAGIALFAGGEKGGKRVIEKRKRKQRADNPYA
jgi:hypothetical protein